MPSMNITCLPPACMHRVVTCSGEHIEQRVEFIHSVSIICRAWKAAFAQMALWRSLIDLELTDWKSLIVPLDWPEQLEDLADLRLGYLKSRSLEGPDQIDWRGISFDFIQDMRAIRAGSMAPDSPHLEFFLQTEPLRAMAAQPTVCQYSPCSGAPICKDQVQEVLRSKECVSDDSMDSFIVLRLHQRFGLLYLHIEDCRMCALCMVSSSPRPILWHIPAIFKTSSPEERREAVPEELLTALQYEADKQRDVGRFWEEFTLSELSASGVYFAGDWGLDNSSSSGDSDASSGCEGDNEL